MKNIFQVRMYNHNGGMCQFEMMSNSKKSVIKFLDNLLEKEPHYKYYIVT